MTGWEISILCLVAVIAFSLFVIAVFSIIKAIALAKVASSINKKLHSIMDPLVNAASRVGRRVDDETEFLDKYEKKFGFQRENDWVSTLVDVVKWTTIGATIFSRFRKRR